MRGDSSHEAFTNGAKAYSAYRPGYPAELYSIILQFAGLHQHDIGGLAVDVATGQGQAALQLSKRFQKVIALDANTQQLAHARYAPNIEYIVADAEYTGLPDNCAGLVTAASALHWFDQKAFYREARRILKPGGTLAAWAIPLGLATITVPQGTEAGDAVTAALRHIYSEVLGPYWSKKRACVENMYRGVEPSSADFGTVELRQLTMTKELSVEQLVGYVSSWSSYSSYCEANPGAEADPLMEFQSAVLKAMGTEDVDSLLQVHIPLALVMAKDPLPLQE